MTESARDLPARRQAQQRADDIRVFRAELARLQAAGVVDLGADAQQAIVAHHAALLADYAAAYDLSLIHI